MRMSDKGLVALAVREAIVLRTYIDSVGVPTIGVGHTAAAGPPKPAPGLTISLKEALDLFRKDVGRYERDVLKAVKVPLKQHEFDALVSFHYNTGAIGRATLTKLLNKGDRIGAAAAFMSWTTPVAITSRRRSEQRQFVTGDYGNTSKVPVYDKFPGKARLVSTAGLFQAPTVPVQADGRVAAVGGPIIVKTPPAAIPVKENNVHPQPLIGFSAGAMLDVAKNVATEMFQHAAANPAFPEVEQSVAEPGLASTIVEATADNAKVARQLKEAMAPKSMLASTTIRGIITAGVGFIAKIAGLTLAEGDTQTIVTAISSLIEVIGLGVAWYGRVNASRPIGTPA